METKGAPGFRPGDDVKANLMVKQKSLHPYRDRPGQYLNLVLGNRWGEVSCKVWKGGEALYARYAPGDVVRVDGKVEDYNGQLQLRLRTIEPAGGYDVTDFIPVSPRDRSEMLVELSSLVEGIGNPYLRGLLKQFTEDPGLAEAFSRAPAAKRHHQAYLGGLMEHTLNVAQLCKKMAEVYVNQVDADLLVAGALLHDIGKVKEFNYDRLIDYTDQGRLLGHIVLGAQMVAGKIDSLPEFPPELKLKVLHIIVSHHGEYEWQSPKRPKFLEALLVHRADLIDADAHKFAQVTGEGMVYSRELDRYVYLGARDAAAGMEESQS